MQQAQTAMPNTEFVNSELELRAPEALRSLLGQVSVIKLLDIRSDAKGAVLAHVDVLGHSHTLACEVRASARPENLRSELSRLLHDTAHHNGTVIPVLIAPYLSPEAQAVCKESHAGFLDLEGNARLAVGEVFIGKRAFTPRASVASAVPHALRGGHSRQHPHPVA
jgi:hypothetical protein